jgi:hypothetical protein
MFYASADALTVRGRLSKRAGSGVVTIPLSEVVRMEEKRRNWKKTGVITGVTVGILALTIHLVTQNNTHFLSIG